MESPSTKRAYAATLAASLGVANEEATGENVDLLSDRFSAHHHLSI